MRRVVESQQAPAAQVARVGHLHGPTPRKCEEEGGPNSTAGEAGEGAAPDGPLKAFRMPTQTAAAADKENTAAAAAARARGAAAKPPHGSHRRDPSPLPGGSTHGRVGAAAVSGPRPASEQRRRCSFREVPSRYRSPSMRSVAHASGQGR